MKLLSLVVHVYVQVLVSWEFISIIVWRVAITQTFPSPSESLVAEVRVTPVLVSFSVTFATEAERRERPSVGRPVIISLDLRPVKCASASDGPGRGKRGNSGSG